MTDNHPEQSIGSTQFGARLLALVNKRPAVDEVQLLPTLDGDVKQRMPKHTPA
jgi:hypothetical protein